MPQSPRSSPPPAVPRDPREGPRLLPPPPPELLAHLQQLPVEDAIWFGGRVPIQLKVDDVPQGVDLSLWVDLAARQVRAVSVAPSSEQTGGLTPLLVTAMGNPVAPGKPCRPKRLGVQDEAERWLLQCLASPLDMEFRDDAEIDFDLFDAVVAELVAELQGMPSMLERGDLKPEMVAAFYAAAGDLWDAAPWRHVEADKMLRVEGLSSSPVLVSVQGHSGEPPGLVVHLPEQATADLSRGSSKKPASPCLRLGFSSESEVGPLMPADAKHFGWKCPAPDVYPVPVRADRKGPNTLATMDEIRLLMQVVEIVLKAPLDAGQAFQGRLRVFTGAEIMASWPAALEGASEQAPADVLQVKVTLMGTETAIWRRVLLPGSTSLAALHETLQDAMGWKRQLPWQVRLGKRRFKQGGGEVDCTTLRDLRLGAGACLEYVYGSGRTAWIHRVEVEKVAAAEQGAPYPRCLEGERACPPEDSGGARAFETRLRRWTKAPPREQGLFPRGWKPERFDAGAVNRKLQKRSRWRAAARRSVE